MSTYITSEEELPYYTCFKCEGKGYYTYITRKQITVNNCFHNMSVNKEGVCEICHGHGELREDEYVYRL